MADLELPDAMRNEVRAAWQRYVDLLVPFRPSLHRYCRELSGDLWETEDLVQDALARAFADLGKASDAIEDPRAFLLRAADAAADLHQRRSQARRFAPSTLLVDSFVEALNARDMAGLVKLTLENASLDMLGCGLQFGRDLLESGFYTKAIDGHPEWPPELQYESARVERADCAGEPAVLGFATRRGREVLEQVLRLEEKDGCVARIRAYAFCPETMKEIGSELGLRVRTGLYRYPTPQPGKFF